MTPQAICLALSAALVLAGAGVSLLALWRARAILSHQPNPAPPSSAAADTAMELLQQKLDLVQQDLQDLRQHAPAATVNLHAPAMPRAGMNLDKRSQALRMHRRGEQPAQIAAALDIPLQEVELLLKVHRIVLSTI